MKKKKNAQLFSVFKCVCGINSPVTLFSFFFFFFFWSTYKKTKVLSLSFSSVIIYCCCASNHWEPFYQPQSYWPKTDYCMWDPPFDFRVLTLNLEFWFNHLFPHATIPLYSPSFALLNQVQLNTGVLHFSIYNLLLLYYFWWILLKAAF